MSTRGRTINDEDSEILDNNKRNKSEIRRIQTKLNFSLKASKHNKDEKSRSRTKSGNKKDSNKRLHVEK